MKATNEEKMYFICFLVFCLSGLVYAQEKYNRERERLMSYTDNQNIKKAFDHVIKAFNHEKEKNFESALSELKKAKELNSDGKALTHAFKKNPYLWKFPYYYRKTGRYQKAIKYYEKMLKQGYHYKAVSGIYFALKESRNDQGVIDELEKRYNNGQHSFGPYLIDFLLEKQSEKYINRLSEKGIDDLGYIQPGLVQPEYLKKAIKVADSFLNNYDYSTPEFSWYKPPEKILYDMVLKFDPLVIKQHASEEFKEYVLDKFNASEHLRNKTFLAFLLFHSGNNEPARKWLINQLGKSEETSSQHKIQIIKILEKTVDNESIKSYDEKFKNNKKTQREISNHWINWLENN